MGVDQSKAMKLGSILQRMMRNRSDSRESKLYKDIDEEKRAFKGFARRFSLGYDSEYAHYFSSLGIRPTRDKAAIREAYRTIIKAYHPDVNKSLLSEEITREANAAYRFLSNYSIRSEGESLPKESRSLILDQLFSEYERLLEADHKRLVRSLGGGSVEKWYYDQEIGKYLDWRKRSALAVDNFMGDFMELGKCLYASIKACRKLLRHETDAHKKMELRNSLNEIEYLHDRHMHFRKLIESDVLKEFYDSAKRNSDEVRKRMSKSN